MVVFTGSGVLIYAQETSAAFRGQASAILVHDLATFAVLPLILGHLYLSLIHPATRHSLHGMVLAPCAVTGLADTTPNGRAPPTMSRT
jgi:hypothetical protein